MVYSNSDERMTLITKNEVQKLISMLEGGVEERLGAIKYMDLYTIFYYLRSYSPHDIYDICRVSFEDYMKTKVLPSIRDKNGETMLRELVKRWGSHRVIVRWLKRFCQYYEQYRYSSRETIPTVCEVAIRCFKYLVYGEVKDKVRELVLVLVEKEREGEKIDRALMKNVVEVFVGMGMGEMDRYEEDFEALMVEKTGLYYSRKAVNWVLGDSFTDFMVKAEACLKKERERVTHYLHWSSEKKLVERVQHELFMVLKTKMIEKEGSRVRALLRDDNVEEISRMFSLYHVIPAGLEVIAHVFRDHVTDQGTILVQKPAEAHSNFVRKLIELHAKYTEYVNSCFLNHALFHKALKEAFEVFCNKTIAGGTSNAELFASFCDETLKKARGDQKLSDEAIEETLENLVKMLVYITDKDLFAEFYHKMLARRLLFARGADMDREKGMLSKLKQQFGSLFTSKMEGMVTDLALAKDNHKNFANYMQKNPHETLGIEFSVKVLTTRCWPNFKSFDLNLPPEMLKCIETFSRFYQKETQRRKLTWNFSLGYCIVKGHFNAKTIELVMSTYQAAVLLLFNNVDRLTYEEIKNELNVDSTDLDRLLHSLSCSKYEILKKEPRNKTISPTDIFEFNSQFTDPMRRIKIPILPVDDQKNVTANVERDRRYTIEAGLVRIMKARKVLSHQQLVLECIQQLGKMFKPDIKNITKRIDDLISRDYLQSDEKDANLLKYIA